MAGESVVNPRSTIEELRDRIRPLQGYVDMKIKHVATTSYYYITDIHYRESDMSIEFSYRACHKDPIVFARPINELLDGRFVLV